MEPVEFNEQNTTFAKDQKEYRPLPAHYDPESMSVISCWGLSLSERLQLLFTGRIWLSVTTFGHPLQPLYMSAKTLFVRQPRKSTKVNQAGEAKS